MRNNLIARAVTGACLAALSFGAPAADWTPDLIAPAKSIRGPSDPVRIKLPKQLPVEVLQRLSLELDDMDVTGMVSRDGDFAVFTPPQPLPFGEHQLRLVENAADGNIIERGTWTLAIRKSALFREAQFQANVTAIAAQRVADDDLPQPEPEKFQTTAAAQLAGAIADGNWRMMGQMDLLYASEKLLLPRGDNGNHIDVGTFLLAYEHGPVVAQAGHHAVGPESLIMQNFTRRGVSVGLQSAEQTAAVTAFALHTADVIGFQEGFGVSDSENRTDGIVMAGRPISSAREALALSATWLAGEGPDQAGQEGTGVVGDPTVTSGKAADVIADGNLLGKRLRLRGEYAATSFDFDGEQGRDADLNGTIDSNLDAERDDAYSALITFVPWHDKMVNNQPLVWNMGVENKRLGTFFRSPANPTGVSDRDLLRAFTGVNWSGFDAQLSLGQETDNVNDLALLPRTETMQGVVSVSWTPQLNQQPRADGSPPPLPWHGQPAFNVTYIDVDQDVDRAGGGLSVGALTALTTFAASASFTYQAWSWSLSHTLGANDNFIATAPDTDTAASQLNASFRIGEKLTFTPMAQYSETEETDPPVGFTAKDSTTTTVGVGLGYAFTERVNANVAYNFNNQDATDNSQDVQSRDVTGSLAWLAIPPQGAQPGLTLSLDGLYHDVDDRVFTINTVNNYQVFLKAAVNWQPSF